MAKTHRSAEYFPRREPTMPVRTGPKKRPDGACTSCGRVAGCNCWAFLDDEQDDADLEGLRLQKIEASERHVRDHSCAVCGRISCRHDRSEDDPLISMCLICGYVGDEICGCKD